VSEADLEKLRAQVKINRDKGRERGRERDQDKGDKSMAERSGKGRVGGSGSGGSSATSSSFVPRSMTVQKKSRAELERRSRIRKAAMKRKERGGGRDRRPEFKQQDTVMDSIHQQISKLKKSLEEKKQLAVEEGEITDRPGAPETNDDDDDDDHSEYDDAGDENTPPSPVMQREVTDTSVTDKKEMIVEEESQESKVPPAERIQEDSIEDDTNGSKRLKSVHVPAFMGSRSVMVYTRLNTIEEGTYGVVHRARDADTGEVVALKKIKMEKPTGSFPITSLREINILMAIDHPNIVKLKEIVIGEDLKSIYMVMEYLDHDMKQLLGQIKQPFRQSEVKTLMRQLLSAVDALHKGWILHRDLKTSNLLYSNDGTLKICDFGLARKYGSPIGEYTLLVVTLWYRAPELLLGSKKYTEAVDMWSVGCIFAEFLTRKPLLPGRGEMDQLEKMFDLLGSPTKEQWPDFENLKHAKNFRWAKNKKSKLRNKFPKQNFGGGFYLDDLGFDLLIRLLAYDPKKRISAEDALNHDWFKAAPRPQALSLMPTFPSANERNRRKKSSKKVIAEEKKDSKESSGGGFVMH